MPEKVKSVVYFLDNHEWINTVMGIIMLVTGVGLLFNYSATINQLIIVIGLFSILKGFLNFNNFFIVDSKFRHYKNKNIFIVGAILNIIMGVVLILNIFTNHQFLLIFTSMWMLLDSIPYVKYALDRKSGSDYKVNPYVISYSLVLICAIGNYTTFYSSFIGAGTTLGCFLIIATANLFLFMKEHQ
ncbi:MAG: hypothetical protein RR554_09270 [Vagococcus sp.]|uniref:DUF308 domain-containing protein n=1 Tax=Vagococcus sp. TaxID=1933889 RepID=UPI002FCAB71B